MAVLVLADHQDGALSQPTRSTVAAAAKLGDVHVLIAGHNAGAAAAAAADLLGFQWLVVEAPELALLGLLCLWHNLLNLWVWLYLHLLDLRFLLKCALSF